LGIGGIADAQIFLGKASLGVCAGSGTGSDRARRHLGRCGTAEPQVGLLGELDPTQLELEAVCRYLR